MRTTPNERIEDLTQRGWWGEETLDTLLHTAVRASPDHLALVDQFNRIEFCDGEAQRLTFAEVGRAADNLAAAFFDSGLRQDDIVVVQLPNIAELAMIYLALGKLGVIISPVPVQYGPFELDKAQQLLEPAAFITLSNFKGKNFATEHGKVFTGDAIVFSFGEDVPKNAVAIALSTELPSKTGEYAAYIRNIDISANDIFTICWTSGTTGQPKGVPRSHIYQLIRSGQVRVNSGRTQPKYRLKAGDKVRVPPVRRRAPAAAPGTGEGLDWLAERIIFEDNRLLVVDKPACRAWRQWSRLRPHRGTAQSAAGIEDARARASSRSRHLGLYSRGQETQRAEAATCADPRGRDDQALSRAGRGPLGARRGRDRHAVEGGA